MGTGGRGVNGGGGWRVYFKSTDDKRDPAAKLDNVLLNFTNPLSPS